MLVGDQEFPELEGQPVSLGDQALPASAGHSPIEVSLWEVRASNSSDAPQYASFEAARRSGLLLEGELAEPTKSAAGDELSVLVAAVTLIVRVEGKMALGDPVGRALELVQRLQLGYRMAMGGPATELLSLERLPVLVPMILSPGPPEPLTAGRLVTVHYRPPSAMRFEWQGAASNDDWRRIIDTMGLLPLLATKTFFALP